MANVLTTVGQAIGSTVAPQVTASVQQATSDITGEVRAAGAEVKQAATISLVLQALSTAAIVALAYFAYQDYKKRHGSRKEK